MWKEETNFFGKLKVRHMTVLAIIIIAIKSDVHDDDDSKRDVTKKACMVLL